MLKVKHRIRGERPMFGFDRITFDRNIMAGQACIRGMRVPVSLVLNLVANGKTGAEIIADYPYLELEDIRQSLQYAAWLTQERVYVQQRSESAV
jgi:uncharacterized protein (DUF433 family)